LSCPISLVPDRLAHYRTPVFDNLAKKSGVGLTVYADLRDDPSGIRNPSEEELEKTSFIYKRSRDLRYRGRLLMSTGSIKASLDASRVIVLWGDAFAPGNWLAALLAKIRRKKLVFWTHGLYGNEGFLKRRIRVLFYSLADALLLYGQNAKRLLTAEGLSPNQLFVINNALDFEKQNRFFQLYGKKLVTENTSNQLNIIFVGRLTKEKKLNMLLEAASLLSDRVDIIVSIVGDGSERKSLEEQAKNKRLLGRVVFYGAIYDEDRLAQLISASDIMVSPGNVGLTAMHALAYGTPVVSHSNASTQMPEFEAICPDLTGDLFEENNLHSLCESMLRCKHRIIQGDITSSGCRKVLTDYYSLEYQMKVFGKCLTQGLGIDEL
jgi:glycosyltransferase involved in cell wall biosynthesis